MQAHESRPARRPFVAQHGSDARVVLHRRADVVQHKPVFKPAGNHAGGKQHDAGEGRPQQRRAEQRERLQHMVRTLRADHRTAQHQRDQGIDQQHRRNHHENVAKHRRHLRAHQMRDFIDKVFQRGGRLVGIDVLELGGHRWRGHGRLLGGQREMQQLDQHK